MDSFATFLFNESNDMLNSLAAHNIHRFDGNTFFKSYGDDVVKIDMQPTYDGVRISFIEAVPNDKGLGSKFMKEFTQMADDTNATLRLGIQEQKGGPSAEKLRSFYSKFGFQVKDGSEMIRHPNYETPVIKLKGQPKRPH